MNTSSSTPTTTTTSSSSSSTQPWEVIPITRTFQNNQTKIIIQNDPTSNTGKTSSDIQQNMNQSTENTKYDTINPNSVKPLTGGKKKKNEYEIEFRNKKYKYMLEYEDENEELRVLETFMNQKKFKCDHMIKLMNKTLKTENLYHIKNTKTNRIRKLY